MCATKQFNYKGKSYSIIVSKSARGEFVGIPDIDGLNLPTLGHGAATENEAFEIAKKLQKKQLIPKPIKVVA